MPQRCVKAGAGQRHRLVLMVIELFGQFGVITERGDHIADVDQRFAQGLTVIGGLQLRQLFLLLLNAMGDGAQTGREADA